MEIQVKAKTITLEGYEPQVMFEALRDHRREWTRRIHEAKMGDRPSMSIDGAEMIVQDIDSILNKLA
jgi:hypothetical protein